MKAKKTGKCKDCNACKRMYTKFYHLLFRDSEFYCTLREEIINRENGCEQWKKKRVEYDLSARRFDEMEADIKFLLERLK